jgi:uncharacterized membrane protein
MSARNRDDHPTSLPTNRLEAFSDGVFAIAITLLVLEITVPPDSDDRLLDAFFEQWPSYVAYVSSFAIIGLVWLAHNGVTDFLERVDAVFVRINLVLLMVVSFIPFPTRLLAEYSDSENASRVATTIYGLTILAVTTTVWGLWRYALSARLVKPHAKNEDLARMTRRLTPGFALYATMLLLGLFLPRAAVVGYVVISVLLLVPFELLPSRRAERPPTV